MEKHSERAHALLSASKSDRWLNCTPSARLEDEIPDLTTSVYALEGTLAHELAQLYLMVDNLTEAEYDTKLEAIYSDKLFDMEMLDEVPKYVEYCEDALLEAQQKTPDAEMLIEQKVDFSKWVKEGFGTTDCCIIADGTLEVIDLKYGKGVLVDAVDNTQGMCYALGAYEKFSLLYDIKEVKITIVQPRRNSVSSDTWAVEDLLEWANTVLLPKAEMAWNGTGEQVPGEWCKFCKVKAQCRALADQNLALAKFEFKNPYLLEDDEIEDILTKAPLISDWANSVKDFAFTEALSGRKEFKGFKIVSGVARRKWADEIKAAKVLENTPGLTSEDIYTTKLNALTTIEKKIGKKRFAEELGDLIIKPAGAPTLVPISDPRPAAGIAQAKEDFKD